MENGNLVNHLNMNKHTLITFDKDFLNDDILIHHGVIILDIHPNRDEFSVPLLKEFLKLLKDGKIEMGNKKILLNREYLKKNQ
jgi:hypothetical protein